MHTIASFISLLAVGVGIVNAVALSDFRPATTGLSSTCNRVYRSQIPGCQTTDFQGGNGCSNNCVQGLLQINSDVATGCQNANVPSNSIIGIFLAGKGIRALCNIEVVTKTLGDTPTTPTPTLTPTPLPLPPPATTMSLSTLPMSPQSISPQPTSVRSTMTISTISSSATSVVTIPLTSTSKPSSPSSPSTAPTATVASQTSGQKPLPICKNPGNGQGGSPFDQVPNRDCIISNPAISLQASFILILGGLFTVLAAQH
jgi:hypothetical protein